MKGATATLQESKKTSKKRKKTDDDGEDAAEPDPLRHGKLRRLMKKAAQSLEAYSTFIEYLGKGGKKATETKSKIARDSKNVPALVFALESFNVALRSYARNGGRSFDKYITRVQSRSFDLKQDVLLSAIDKPKPADGDEEEEEQHDDEDEPKRKKKKKDKKGKKKHHHRHHHRRHHHMSSESEGEKGNSSGDEEGQDDEDDAAVDD
jgi:hypothetical protein